jgi:hypothetical protein
MVPVKAGAARTHRPRVAEATKNREANLANTTVIRGCATDEGGGVDELLLVKTSGRSYERKNFASRREGIGLLIPEMHYV